MHQSLAFTCLNLGLASISGGMNQNPRQGNQLSNQSIYRIKPGFFPHCPFALLPVLETAPAVFAVMLGDLEGKGGHLAQLRH